MSVVNDNRQDREPTTEISIYLEIPLKKSPAAGKFQFTYKYLKIFACGAQISIYLQIPKKSPAARKFQFTYKYLKKSPAARKFQFTYKYIKKSPAARKFQLQIPLKIRLCGAQISIYLQIP